MMHLRPTHDPAPGTEVLLDREPVSAVRGALRWLDARALLFGVLATMGSLLSIALGNDLALGVSIGAMAAAFAVTTVVGAGAAAASARIATTLAAKAGLPPTGRVAGRYGTSVWVAVLLATAIVLRAVFTDGIEQWTVVVAAAGCVLVAAIGIALADARRRRN